MKGFAYFWRKKKSQNGKKLTECSEIWYGGYPNLNKIIGEIDFF